MPNENQDQNQKQPEVTEPTLQEPQLLEEQVRIKTLEEKLQRVSTIAHIQRSELRRAAIRINEMERALMVTQNRLDEIASTVIYFIRSFGEKNEIKIPHKELENLVPGTVIDDTQQDENFRYIRIVDVPVQFHPSQAQSIQSMLQPGAPLPQFSPEEMGVPPPMNKDGSDPQQPQKAEPQLKIVSDTKSEV
jgi:hypothetical protein